MAINIDEFKLPITPAAARNFLQQQTDDFGVFFDVDRINEIICLKTIENTYITAQMARLTDKIKVSPNNKESIAEYLVMLGTPKRYFYPNGKLSVSAATLLEASDDPRATEDIKQFIKVYSNFTSNKRNIGYLANLAKLPLSTQYSKLGHKMSIGHPTWTLLSTSRISASDPGVQGVPRDMGDIICEPQGYTLVRADSGQIEPRINFSYFLRDETIMKLIMHYNDAYFGLMHYCIMSDEEIAALNADFETNFRPVEVTDDMKDKRQFIKRMTNAASYGSSKLTQLNPELGSSYEKRIVKHPKRVALESQVRDAVNQGCETFYGAFGTPVTPDSTERYSRGSSGWKEHLIRCGLNNPVQTTASELMMFSVNKAREVLSRAKDSHVCFYKHDEACFYVSDEDAKNGILDELKDVTAYNVVGWIPIDSDPLIGVKHGDIPSTIMG